MASYPQPIPTSFRAGGTIVQGHAVKIGADAQHVIECTATSDLSIGIALADAASGDAIEVALGGGCAGKAGASINKGKKLMSTTDGTIIEATTTCQVVGIALEDASAADLFGMLVVQSTLP